MAGPAPEEFSATITELTRLSHLRINEVIYDTLAALSFATRLPKTTRVRNLLHAADVIVNCTYDIRKVAVVVKDFLSDTGIVPTVDIHSLSLPQVTLPEIVHRLEQEEQQEAVGSEAGAEVDDKKE